MPIIINECYKANFGYSTALDASAMLGYYGVILGASITVVTLVVTIKFTPKHIERKIKLRGQSKTDYLIRALADKPIIYIGNGNEILAELKRQGNNLNQGVKIIEKL